VLFRSVQTASRAYPASYLMGTEGFFRQGKSGQTTLTQVKYEGWNFNSGIYLFTTDTKQIHVSKFYCPSM